MYLSWVFVSIETHGGFPWKPKEMVKNGRNCVEYGHGFFKQQRNWPSPRIRNERAHCCCFSDEKYLDFCLCFYFARHSFEQNAYVDVKQKICLSDNNLRICVLFLLLFDKFAWVLRSQGFFRASRVLCIVCCFEDLRVTSLVEQWTRLSRRAIRTCLQGMLITGLGMDETDYVWMIGHSPKTSLSKCFRRWLVRNVCVCSTAFIDAMVTTRSWVTQWLPYSTSISDRNQMEIMACHQFFKLAQGSSSRQTVRGAVVARGSDDCSGLATHKLPTDCRWFTVLRGVLVQSKETCSYWQQLEFVLLLFIVLFLFDRRASASRSSVSLRCMEAFLKQENRGCKI